MRCRSSCSAHVIILIASRRDGNIRQNIFEAIMITITAVQAIQIYLKYSSLLVAEVTTEVWTNWNTRGMLQERFQQSMIIESYFKYIARCRWTLPLHENIPILKNIWLICSRYYHHLRPAKGQLLTAASWQDEPNINGVKRLHCQVWSSVGKYCNIYGFVSWFDEDISQVEFVCVEITGWSHSHRFLNLSHKCHFLPCSCHFLFHVISFVKHSF